MFLWKDVRPQRWVHFVRGGYPSPEDHSIDWVPIEMVGLLRDFDGSNGRRQFELLEQVEDRDLGHDNVV